MATTKKLSLILLIAAIAVISWYAISLSKNQVQPGNNKSAGTVNNTTSSEPIAVATSTKDWLTYRNEEYGFEVKYPNSWRWEDQTNKNLRLKIGFYPPNKKAGYEYEGDIELSMLYNEGNLNLEDWYKKSWNNEKPVAEKIERKITKNKIESIIEFNTPDMFGGSDSAVFMCNNYPVRLYAVARMSTAEMLSMVNEFKCY